MGVIYRAEDQKLQRHVALKFLPAGQCQDEQFRQRFLSEARAASRLDHPNICVIHDVNETPDGQKFAYIADQETDGFVELYAVQLESGSVQKPSYGLGSAEVVEFAWSEDSARITFTAGEARRVTVADQLYSDTLEADDLQLLSDMSIESVNTIRYLY